ncbi:YebC-like protein [Ramaria rubella]|nr:YebC-like protein [Ramaria rubella]
MKSKIYSKANRDIIFAVRKGDSMDPLLNNALATAIAKAKANGVPKSNIQAALDQAQKKGRDANEEFQYEALFAGKVGLMIECLSDNNTRTLRELKEIVKDHGAQLTSVSYMFEKKALLQVSLRPGQAYDDLWSEAVDHGAHDLTGSAADDTDPQGRVIEVSSQLCYSFLWSFTPALRL